ncbi:HAD family phosphatase [Candidatus Kuenenbacteria bacterium]|nr:HAD family phosphatase [Candidatus Kuenenbacteria bacterium]
MLNKYKFYFFDFDGVIVDTISIKGNAFAELYKDYGDDVCQKVITHHKAFGGVNRYKKIKHYHNEFLNQDISEEQVNDLAEKFSNIVIEKVIKANSIDGALEFLNILKQQNKKVFIVSNVPEKELLEIIQRRNLLDYFADIKGSPESKIQNMTSLIKQFEVDTSKCVYFGDAEADLDAANNCKVEFIPINYYKPIEKGYINFEKLINDWNINYV